MRWLLALMCLAAGCAPSAEAPARLAADSLSPAPSAEASPTDRLGDATRRGDVPGVRAALADGADPNGPEDAPHVLIVAAAGPAETPDDNARQRADSTVVRLLVDAGADLDLARDNDETALHVAAGRLPAMRALLAAGADANDAQNLDQQTPLHIAAATSAAAVRLLLDAGASPLATDAYGNTPLHLAALNGDAEAARMLLDAGARRDARTVDGQTPLDLARTEGHDALAALLGGR